MQTNRVRKLADLIKQFNLYEEDKKLPKADQILSTRIFTCFLIVSILVIVLFTSFTVQTKFISIDSPSEKVFKQLSSKYSHTLSCLCQQNSIVQGEIVSFHPEYHLICSSQFVNQTFLLSLTNVDVSQYWPVDYRLMVSSHIQLVQIFCRTTKEKITDAIQEFASQYLITTQVLSFDNFQSQMTTLVNQFQQNTINAHKHINNFIWLNTFYNRISSGLCSEAHMRLSSASPTILTARYGTASSYCDCRKVDTCTYPAYIYNDTGRIGRDGGLLYGTTDKDSHVMFILPNMEVGCYPYRSLLSSTFECFYDQSCLSSLQKYIAGFSLVSPLKQSQFAPETLINDILNNLFIEAWNEVYNFSKYYEICSPKLCTYSFDQSFNFLYIAVTIISLFGGLKIILFVSAPFFVRLVQKIQKNISHRKQTTHTQRDGKPNFKNRIRTLPQQIQTYNMFPLFTDIKDGIYSTRLYILFLTLGLIILLFYSSISTQVRPISIMNPSWNVFSQLSQQYSSTLTCPCSHISIKYSSIIDISTTLHQVCSSGFIKDDVWLLYNSNLVGIFLLIDFRTIGMASFRILQKLCLLSNETISNEIAVFNNLQFFTSQVLAEDTFNTQIDSIINQFKQKTVASFYDLYQTVQTSIQVNQLAKSGSIDSNMALLQLNDTIQIFFQAMRVFSNPNCSCGIDRFCETDTGFYCITGVCSGNESALNKVVPNWYTSCSPIDSLSTSSLTCLYNSSCVQMLIDAFPLGMSGVTIDPRAANVTPLNPMINSRFNTSTRLNEIISAMFIEKWIYSIYFDRYFEACAPRECIYTYEERFSISYIIATVAGIIGGLSVALKILVPFFVKSIRRIFRYCCISSEQIEEDSNNARRFATVLNQLRNNVQQMNFYRQGQENDDDLLCEQQRFATRIYSLLFLISFHIIILFLNLNTHINTITVSSPSLSTFNELQSKHASTLTCSCSNIAIPYSKFVSIQPETYHQICSTDFVSSAFITSVWGLEDVAEYTLNYDRKVLSGLFHVLSSFCALTRSTIELNVQTFSTKNLITLQILTHYSFQIQVDSIINNFIVQTLAQFQWMHHYIIDMFHANQLQHRFGLNWASFASNAQMNYVIRTFPIWFNESGESCLCTISPSRCFRTILTSFNQTIRLPGIVFGCLPIDGLRQSTLECLYNSTCLQLLADFLNMTNIPNALNRSVSSRFYPISTTTIGELIDEFFIETWQNSSNYSEYYSSCSPSSCEYSYAVRSSALYILTTFLGLYGGLTVGLKFIVWYSLDIYWKTQQYIGSRRRRTRVVPVNLN
ncbi:unnamed protein product [Adineta ricciae]|uniref:Uncharacterized protein n=1 Tax=Adineta ricciae TaxID=249248 RepID=A0A814TIC0_ADIRI|nr:unnamed protein product [Adineta ricciae]CAF1160087.1 unnamed protein product [Adineta ricciae]